VPYADARPALYPATPALTACVPADVATTMRVRR
jgi:hypothetical protein